MWETIDFAQHTFGVNLEITLNNAEYNILTLGADPLPKKLPVAIILLLFAEVCSTTIGA